MVSCFNGWCKYSKLMQSKQVKTYVPSIAFVFNIRLLRRINIELVIKLTFYLSIAGTNVVISNASRNL
jgi:hypothetical protein